LNILACECTFFDMHFIAPFPIIMGVMGIIIGGLWLIAAGSEEDGGPNTGLFYLFGWWYITMRIIKAMARDPMSVLPAFGILIGSVLLIFLGVAML
jgi:hypothetical protein